MPAYAIHYRLNGAGPAAYLVADDDGYHVYASGSLGPAFPAARVDELLASRSRPWVPASGMVVVEEPFAFASRPWSGAAPDLLLPDPTGRGESVSPSP